MRAAGCSSFLLADYHEEFLHNLKTFVQSQCQVVGAHERAASDVEQDDANREQSKALQKLYGSVALPDDLLGALNASVQQRKHVLPQGSSAEHALGQLLKVLERLCLRIEERPANTRFWLFSQCVHSLFRAHLTLPAHQVFSCPTKNPMPRNQKRVAYVHKFLRDLETGDTLRRVVLSTRLTLHAVSLTGKGRVGDAMACPVRSPDAIACRVRRPLLVRWARGEVAASTQRDLEEIVPHLLSDPDLKDKAGALEQLFVTQMELVARFSQYLRYPFQLVLCCERWNPENYVERIHHEFLDEAEENLDIGYSLPLQRHALRCSAQQLAVDFMKSKRIQAELRSWASGVEGSALEVERAHNLAKRSERRKLLSVATASRDRILRQYRANGQTKLGGVRDEVARRRARHSNVVLVALKKNPGLFPRAVGGGVAKGRDARLLKEP